MPTKAAAETVELDLRLRRKLGQLYVEKPTTLGEELDRHLQRKATLGGKRGKLRPRSLEFVKQYVAPWEPLRDVLIPNLRRAAVEDHVLARAASAPVAARNELQELKTCAARCAVAWTTGRRGHLRDRPDPPRGGRGDRARAR